MTITGYLAAEGFEAELAEELGDDLLERHERLMLARGERACAWAQNTWYAPERVAIRSINDAAKRLKRVQRNWTLYSVTEHRRAALILDALPPVSAKPIVPFTPLPTAPLGAFTLLDRDTLLMAPRQSSPFPHGEVRFLEDKEGPPSRAYLKLWEALTLLEAWPQPGERVIDLGSAPGGWTWVLAELGADVVSVDKAALDPRVAARPNVRFVKESAFALDPAAHPVDWVFSDVICYPDRLLALIERWRAAHPSARFVCTIKLQGETDHAAIARFRAIEGSRLVHLSHNRHELTWILAPDVPAGRPLR